MSLSNLCDCRKSVASLDGHVRWHWQVGAEESICTMKLFKKDGSELHRVARLKVVHGRVLLAFMENYEDDDNSSLCKGLERNGGNLFTPPRAQEKLQAFLERYMTGC